LRRFQKNNEELESQLLRQIAHEEILDELKVEHWKLEMLGK